MPSAAASAVAKVLVAVLAIVASSAFPAVHADTTFISRACRRTQDAALCVAVLSADPRSARADTVHGLADIALDMAVKTAVVSVGAFNGLYFKYVGTPQRGAAKACCRAYLDAANKLVFHARDSFDDRRYAGASELVASAQGAGDRCEDSFKEVAGGSAVTDVNRKMTELFVVTRGLIDLLASSCCACCSKKIF